MRADQRQIRASRLSIALVAFAVVAVLAPVLLSGCGEDPKDSPTPSQPPSDADLVKAQKVCPVTGKDLGSMGKPFKVMVKGEPVFLCCDSCRDQALANPEKTLAKVKGLKNQQNR